MRYSDLVTLPTTSDEAKDSILDLITVAIGNDRKDIPMDEVLSVLHQQGWDLTRRMIMDLLQDNDMIRQITKDKIILNGDNIDDDVDGYSNNDKAEKDQEHVSKMAKKGAKKKQGAV